MAKEVEQNRHHIIPISRGGEGTETIMVDKRLHDLYSQLFQMQTQKKKCIEMTPEEIVHWLNRVFWNEHYDISIRRRYGKEML
ncbi:MAG: hypothetical protein GY861_18115 [bacterium]|nr:hypothetical protein [bacterium]